jgi:hypothetical protein
VLLLPSCRRNDSFFISQSQITKEQIMKKISLVLGVLVLISAAFLGCPTEGGGGSPAFVAVSGITDAATTADVGIPLILTGTVLPTNATNKTIVWSIAAAGTTGATVSGNTLNTTAR